MKFEKKDTVVFDLDGTLLDTLEDLMEAVNYALRCHEMPKRSLSEIRAFVGNGVRLLIERAVPEHTAMDKVDLVFADFKAYYKLHCNDHTKPYEGVVQLMEQLKQSGFSMAIVSNKIDSAVKELNELYFSEWISTAIGEKEGIERKPAPDTVYAALEELGKKKETAVYVGDSDVDFLTAKNAGIPCISVLWGFRDREFLESMGADCFVEKPEEIMQLLITK